MKIMRATGYARLPTAKQAGQYAQRRLKEGLKVHVYFDGDLYRVDFEPDEKVQR